MAKVMVVYESKYGNTKLVAESIIEGMSEVSGTETALRKLKEVDLNQLIDFDVILVGSPNHWGGPIRSIRKFIDNLAKLNLENKRGAVFDTHLAKDFEKAVKKMEKQIGEKVPELKLMAPGLSIRVEGSMGPIAEGELPKCKEFGVKIATLISNRA